LDLGSLLRGVSAAGLQEVALQQAQRFRVALARPGFAPGVRRDTGRRRAEVAPGRWHPGQLAMADQALPVLVKPAARWAARG
jgi:hypothetical protein